MEDPPSPHAVVNHPPSPPPRSNLPMLYYGLLVVGTAIIVLALYNFIVIKWCTEFTDRRAGQRASRGQGPASSWRFRDLNIINFVSSFKYKKDAGDDSECAVCLSAFEEGEELRQLPKCKHSFHAPCIDMWLYSHMDCPLCRSPVEQEMEQAEHSREGLLGPGTLV